MRGGFVLIAGLLGISAGAGCLVVKVDGTDSLTDVSLSDVLTDGFTQTSSSTDTLPTGRSDWRSDGRSDSTATDPTDRPAGLRRWRPSTRGGLRRRQPGPGRLRRRLPAGELRRRLRAARASRPATTATRSAATGARPTARFGELRERGLEGRGLRRRQPGQRRRLPEHLRAGELRRRLRARRGEDCDDGNASNTDACVDRLRAGELRRRLRAGPGSSSATTATQVPERRLRQLHRRGSAAGVPGRDGAAGGVAQRGRAPARSSATSTCRSTASGRASRGRPGRRCP
jgi:hypothetical protein